MRMTPILRQFLAEARDFLQSISEKLLQLEKAPGDEALMSDLFRSVHTLKGNSGLFDFPEMTRVLHSAEDLMSVVRDGGIDFSQALADRLLDAMDFVSLLLDEIEAGGKSGAEHGPASVRIAGSLRELLAAPPAALEARVEATTAPNAGHGNDAAAPTPPPEVPESVRAAWHEAVRNGTVLIWVTYTPEIDCFFKGEDPFFQARQTPQVVWQRLRPTEAWPALADLDPYRCVLQFEMVTAAPRTVLDELYRYVPEQVTFRVLNQDWFNAAAATRLPVAAPAGTTPSAVNLAASAASAASAAGAALAETIVKAQMTALGLSDAVSWLPGRLRAIGATLNAVYRSTGHEDLLPALDAALRTSLAAGTGAAMLELLKAQTAQAPPVADAAAIAEPELTLSNGSAVVEASGLPPPAVNELPTTRRADDSVAAATVLKVDQEKVDRLMNLIGEMVVAKNGLPFLADRAETVYGTRELSREIKNQYAVINRIAEEMQDAIMQVRMMPVSGVFQRFPRLVRDISRKLGKEVKLTLEGEQTEADKNIIEALADPLIHIVRNSLDHGIELPEVRSAAGKSVEGHLLIRATQDSGRVFIEITDDGKGIDPELIKRKAYEKGIIDESTLERITDQEAVNLVFAAGFSTAETVSDLSGRGVGMDVVRTAVERVNGTVSLQSAPGKGTTLRLSLPLSMAVTNVMVVESNQQIFGVPMDMVIETVRVPRGEIRSIKNRETTILRNRILPIRSLNELLSAGPAQVSNDQDELATLVVQIHGEQLGIVVDNFREVVDIILKPMGGILGGVPGYSGSALLGDGSVLMVLNPKELVRWQ